MYIPGFIVLLIVLSLLRIKPVKEDTKEEIEYYYSHYPEPRQFSNSWLYKGLKPLCTLIMNIFKKLSKYFKETFQSYKDSMYVSQIRQNEL